MFLYFKYQKVLLKYGNQIINFNNNKIYLTQLVLLWLIIDNKIIFLVQLTIKIISNNNKSNLETYSILLQLIITLLIQSIYFKILGRINNNQIYSTKMFLLITNLNLNRIITSQKIRILLGCKHSNNNQGIFFNKTNHNYKFKFLINNKLI